MCRKKKKRTNYLPRWFPVCDFGAGGNAHTCFAWLKGERIMTAIIGVDNQSSIRLYLYLFWLLASLCMGKLTAAISHCHYFCLNLIKHHLSVGVIANVKYIPVFLTMPLRHFTEAVQVYLLSSDIPGRYRQSYSLIVLCKTRWHILLKWDVQLCSNIKVVDMPCGKTLHHCYCSALTYFLWSISVHTYLWNLGICSTF